MMRTFLTWLSGRLPCRLINDGGRPYLERYYLFTVIGWRFYLHQFVGSDPDRGLHDHPWTRAFSIILAGWYFEETRSGTRKVRWLNSLTGDSFHRVLLPQSYSIKGGFADRPCWTLFFHRVGHSKTWGFMRTVPDSDGVAIFEPHRYLVEGDQRHWWLNAPTGREVRQARNAT